MGATRSPGRPRGGTGGKQDLLLQLDALQQVTDAALSTLDLENLLDSLLARCMEIVGADGGLVLLLDESETELLTRGARWTSIEPPVRYRRRVGEGIAGKVVLDGKPRLVVETEWEDPQEAERTLRRGIHSVLAVPLRVRGKIIGAFRLDSRQPGRFTDQHLQLMQVAADRMALAIDNARLMREAEERASFQALIHQIASAIGSSLKLDSVVQTTVQKLRAATNCSRCAVVLAASHNESNWARWESRAEGIPAMGSSVIPWRNDPHIHRLMRSREPVAIEDVEKAPLPEGIKALARKVGVRSVLATSLFRGERLIGGLELYQYGETRRWTARELDLLQSVAAQLVVAAENARLYEETDEKLRARVRELGSLLRLGRAVNEQLSLDVVMERAAEELGCALDADRCSLCIADWERALLTVIAARNREGRTELGQGRVMRLAELPDAYRVLSLRQPVELNSEDPRTPSLEASVLREMEIAHALLVPLLAGESATGLVFLGRKPGREGFSTEDTALAQAMVGQVAVAMENAQLFQEVQAQKARMEALLSSMSEGMYATDLTERITAANPSLERMLGRRSGEMLRRRCRDLLAHTDEEGNPLCDSACPMKLALQEGTSTERMTVFTLTVWGKRLPTSISTAPIRDEFGKVIGAVAILRDVSQEWELNKLRSNIISVVSHEFRTPLTSIIGFSELLLMRDQPDQERQTCLEQIHREGLRLEVLVNDFLDVSRLEAGRVALHLEPVDPAAAVKRSLEEAALQAGRRLLRSEIQADLPGIEADPEKLHQILANLLSNAIKYSEDGISITVRARVGAPQRNGEIPAEESAAGRWVIFTVEDQGVGIPVEQLSEIFTPFHRVEGQATRRIRGTGLGLSIVKSLVELHGGALWVESEPGIGSRFHVALRAISH